jgi:hypothetical protein
VTHSSRHDDAEHLGELLALATQARETARVTIVRADATIRDTQAQSAGPVVVTKAAWKRGTPATEDQAGCQPDRAATAWHPLVWTGQRSQGGQRWLKQMRGEEGFYWVILGNGRRAR